MQLRRAFTHPLATCMVLLCNVDPSISRGLSPRAFDALSHLILVGLIASPTPGGGCTGLGPGARPRKLSLHLGDLLLDELRRCSAQAA